MNSADGRHLCRRIALAGLATVIFASTTLAQDASLGGVSQNCAMPVDHAAIRSNMIKLNLLQTETDRAYLVVGDSIVEAAVLQPICGMTPVNAGIGGANAQALSEYVDGWSDRKFEAVIVALGVNNAIRNGPPDIAAFDAAYEVIINKLAATGATVFVADVMPVEKGKALGDAYFDNNVILELNTEIGAMADHHGAPRIDLHDAFVQPGENAMRPGLTVDGVHLNAEGYRVWRRTIAQAVSGKLKCDPSASTR